MKMKQVILAICVISGMSGCATYNKAEKAYVQGRGDAVKEHFWRLQQEKGEAVGGSADSLVYYNIRIPKGSYSPDGRVMDEHWVSVPVVE